LVCIRGIGAIGVTLPLKPIRFETESGLREDRIDEAFKVHGRADRGNPARVGSGVVTSDLCRKHGISSATLYKWKAKHGGLDVSDARRLKALGDESGVSEEETNGRLKDLRITKGVGRYTAAFSLIAMPFPDR
jgi:putative transposase